MAGMANPDVSPSANGEPDRGATPGAADGAAAAQVEHGEATLEKVKQYVEAQRASTAP
jgi:hypothetical protein